MPIITYLHCVLFLGGTQGLGVLFLCGLSADRRALYQSLSLSLSLSLSPLFLSFPLFLSISLSACSPLFLSLIHSLHIFFNDIGSCRDSVMSGCKGLSDFFAFFPSSLSYFVPDIMVSSFGLGKSRPIFQGRVLRKPTFSIQNLHFTDLFDPLADCTTEEVSR